MAREFGRDEPGSRGFRHDVAQHGLSLPDARIRITLAEHDFCAGLVQLRPKHELTRHAARQPPGITADGPTG